MSGMLLDPRGSEGFSRVVPLGVASVMLRFKGTVLSGDCRVRRGCFVVSMGDFLSVGLVPASGNCLYVLKRKKGIWWMPWYREAMKDVAPCDKLRGDGSNL